MTNYIDQLEPDEARKALDSIDKFERVGLQRGISPLWFEITVALLSGVACALAGLNVSRLYLAPLFLLIVLLGLHQTLKAGVIVKPPFSKRMIFACTIGAAVVVMPLILFARAHLDTFGIWLALATGVVVAITVFVVSIFERHHHKKRIDSEKCA